MRPDKWPNSKGEGPSVSSESEFPSAGVKTRRDKNDGGRKEECFTQTCLHLQHESRDLHLISISGVYLVFQIALMTIKSSE